MKIRTRILFLIFTLTRVSLLNAQPILQGEWRDHLSYRRCFQIADVGDVVYCSAESGLISYNKTTHELNRQNKITGLSDVQISSIAYSVTSDLLIIGYDNGNIDLLHPGEDPLNISDIKRRIMTADKRINQVITYGNLAYLACGFGIVVLNLEKQEVKETYILGESGAFIQVYDLAVLDNTLFAATESGIFSADLSSSNLLDYNYWTRLDFIPGFMGEYRIIEVHNGKLFAVYHNEVLGEDKIITISGNSYQEWNKEYGTNVSNVNSNNGYLSISTQNQGIIYDLNELFLGYTSTFNNQNIYVTAEGTIFIASDYSGFLKMDYPNGSLSYLLPSGPRFCEVSQITTYEDRIWITSGGPSRLYKHGGFYSYINGNWKSYNAENIDGLDTLGNTYKIAIDPHDPEHVFVGTYGYGLIEVLENEITGIYEYDNTPVFEGIPKVVNIRVSGIQFDSESNLYFLLSMVSSPLFRVDNEGNWEKLDIDNSILNRADVNYADLLITSHGQIWILSSVSNVIVLEKDGDNDYRQKTFVIKNQFGNLLTKAFCLDEDKEGNIWIGTNNGPIIYYSPWNVFEYAEVTGYQVPIPRNDGTNIIDPLLFSETILDIETDGGNRKWIATAQSGIFLVSDDGKETIHNFKAENSPILSDGVTGIGINKKNGEVFFATDQGLVSYGGIATEGSPTYSDVYVYPNPVRPGYEGPITIKGLVENSIVKITDVSGNLVWETHSLGGQAVWDGNNFKGQRVATGVYLVMLATEDGSQSHITKLLFLH